MCDLSLYNKSSCHGSATRRIGPLKLSKWELPIPSSKSYWDGVCAEIEKKHKRVRDAYPSLSTLSVVAHQASDRTQFHDDFKFKISPPTPMHRVQNLELISKNNDNFDIEIKDEVKVDYELPTTVGTEVKLEKLSKKKIFSKKSCPLHKNTTPVKIFDDDISKYLKTDDTSVPTLPNIISRKKSICDHDKIIRSKSTSASSTHSKERKEILEERRVSKAPKLGMASLLPSFARPVSTDSSAGTRSSFESEEELPKAQSQATADLHSTETISNRDFLRVPNLSFVSLHPSFRKLSFVDSIDDDQITNNMGVGEKSQILEKRNEDLEMEEKVSEGTERKIKITKKKVEENVATSMPDLDKKYSYKALEVLTKKKHINIERKIEESSSEKSITASEVSSIPDVPKIKKLMRSLDKESTIDFQEVRQKLKRLISRDSQAEKSVSLDLDKIEAKTIYSASRSTSGSSPDFESKAIEIPKADAFDKIPETKVFQRAYIDKCHACILKPFKSETKIIRELPLTTLVSIVKNPPEFSVDSSSSSSTTEEIRIPSIYDNEDDFLDFSEYEQTDFSEDISKTKEQDQPRVSFNQSNLTPTETKEKSQSPKPTSDQYLKEKSFSIPSSDRSRTSTPSNQSSDSDDARGLQDMDQLPSSKFMAPCHAPIVLRKSFEPLRALKQKKFVSLRTRAAAITAKSSDGSESESQEDDNTAKKTDEVVEEEKKEKKKKKKKKMKKKLVRMKSVAEKMTEFSSSMDTSDVKDKKMLKRAKTTFDLLNASDESKSEETSEEDEEEEVSVESKETKVEKKEEPLPLSDLILKHRAASPPPPIMSQNDVIDIIKRCLAEDSYPAKLLDSLSKEFVERLNERYEKIKHSKDAKYLKLGLNLFNALIDSRRYLKPSIYDPNLQLPHKQPPLTNPRQLRRILPAENYELVAPILGMPKYFARKKFRSTRPLSLDVESTDSFGLFVHPPASRGRGRSYNKKEVNPYALFLTKPRRQAVIWRPLREEDMKGYDPEATLEMRATRLMDRICKEFCDWVRQLGQSEKSIDEETLKDMFEINFSADACKSTQIIIKEMPTVPLPVVEARYCPEANVLEATRKQLREDVELEALPKRTFAFGRSLPRGLRFLPPRTSIAGKWLECEHIPKDLDNMDVVWDDIGNLDSVQEFYKFLKSKKVLKSKKLLKAIHAAIQAKA